jgi:hypothetical protein
MTIKFEWISVENELPAAFYNKTSEYDSCELSESIPVLVYGRNRNSKDTWFTYAVARARYVDGVFNCWSTAYYYADIIITAWAWIPECDVSNE